MKINIKKSIKKPDWKSFVSWVNDEQFTFGNENFYTGLLSVNTFKIDKYIIDFFIYNKFILKNKYELNWPEWLMQSKGKDIFSWIDDLFTIWFKEMANSFKELIPFFKKLREYRLQTEKDYDKEYELVKIYWKFMNRLRNEKAKNYNSWIIYININTYIKMKGYK